MNPHLCLSVFVCASALSPWLFGGWPEKTMSDKKEPREQEEPTVEEMVEFLDSMWLAYSWNDITQKYVATDEDSKILQIIKEALSEYEKISIFLRKLGQ